MWRWKRPERLATAAGTLAVATAGGAAAAAVGLPMPWLIGSQVTLCLVALLRLPIFGHPPCWPRAGREIFLPVIGVMIGASFTADVVRQMPHWWISLAAISVFLVVAHLAVFALFRRVGGYDRPTAFFAAFPGGFIEATVLGTEAGGNQRLIQIQHFLRISLIVLLVPPVFAWLSGHPVGSAAGAALNGPGSGLSLSDALVLLAAGAAGTLIGRRLRIPAPDISGAIAGSAAVYLAGLVEGRLPAPVVALAQLMVGTSLGVAFVGIDHRELGRALGMAAVALAAVAALGLAFAGALAALAGLPLPTTVLAFAPGGLAEMSLIALSLHLSVPFVTVHHLYRIVFTIAVLPRLYGLVAAGPAPPGG
ncbi:AbrB family transcriptional regulator [Azospirillum halopraeferens]|uniref:AbrB family transcriptional regulator n=1 Tax=Azospirillum halopraeferens TaxID=34010 RepID=UPI0003FC86B7|nr:AbrB family transcriptional regulator [Azospirillum halopraeferens]